MNNYFRNRLWSDTFGLPADIVQIQDLHCTASSFEETLIPSSFQVLLMELWSKPKESVDTDQCSLVLEPVQRAICSLVTRFLLNKPKLLLPHFLSRNRRCNNTIEVLTSILLLINQMRSNDSSSYISLNVGIYVLDLLETNRHLQAKIRQNPSILNGVPLKISVVSLLKILNNSEADSAKSAASISLQSIVENSSQSHANEIVTSISTAFIDMESETNAENAKEIGCHKKTSTSVADKLCLKYGPIWKKVLLTSSLCGDSGYSNFISAIVSAMFLKPSSIVPLSLFGAVIGDDNLKAGYSSIKYRIRLHNALTKILELGLNEIKRVEKMQNKGEESGSFKVDIFIRLSPLLMLRRIPCVYFRLLRENNDEDCHLMKILVDIVAAKLGLGDQDNQRYGEVKLPEERRLLAEIAARSLPFTPLQGQIHAFQTAVTTFERICKPSFVRTMELLEGSNTPQNEKNSKIEIDWKKRARSSLYIACLYIPLAKDDELAEALLSTIEFCLVTLSFREKNEIDDMEKETIKLQTGCSDFFAICLESYCARIRQQRADMPKN